MSLNNIRNALVSKIEGAGAAAKVYTQQPFVRNDAARAIKVETDARATNIWIVERESASTSRRGLTGYTVLNTWVIECYTDVDPDNNSRISMDNSIERLQQALLSDLTLGGVVADLGQTGEAGLSIERVEDVVLYAKVCHAAQMRLTTIHYE